MKSYKPRNQDVNHLRILFLGPVGAGKSSFINSIDSVLQGRVTGRGLTDATSGKSFTKKVSIYLIYLQTNQILIKLLIIVGLNEDLLTPYSAFSTKLSNSPKAVKVITPLFATTSWAWSKRMLAFMWTTSNLP